MKDLFDEKYEEELRKDAPLADKMRPRDFESFFGQEEIVGEESPLRKMIQDDSLGSIILWGPPGSGKTTLANIVAQKTSSKFIKFSAVSAGVKDIRRAVEQAKRLRKFSERRTILFLDEIHRFNKAQQDRLLPHVESGILTLIGATTENPSFEVISPLLSRSSVFVLKRLSEETLKKIMERAIEEESMVEFKEEALDKIAVFADGDARAALNALESVARYGGDIVSAEDASQVLAKQALRYDKKGEEHYNLISAFIKSMRASDVDAALYWMARMINSGEDPRFIARRMVVFASEDVGVADPTALQIAVSAFRALEMVGLPEARINLAEAVVYLSHAEKNRSVYDAISRAEGDAQDSRPVPMHLRNAPTELMEDLGYGEGEGSNLPEGLEDKKYYHE